LAFQPFPIDSPWSAVLATAVRAPGAPRDARLFLEQREDVRRTWADGRTTGYGTHWRGLCAELPGRSLHVSDPLADHVARILHAAGEEDRPVSKGSPVHPPDVGLPTGVEREALEVVIERLAHAVARHGPGLRASVTAVAFEQHVWTAHREQGCVEDRRRSVRLRLEVETERGSRRARAVAEVARATPRDIDDAVVSRLASHAVERLEARLDLREAPAGQLTAVLAPGVGGILAHEIVGHALEADRVRGRSWLAEPSGAIAPPELLILDDPRRGRAPWRVDDEGVESRPTALIDGGHVVGCLHDRRSATRVAARPTGHGRRASFRDPVLPRMGCTYIAAGSHDATEIISGVERGVYVRRMEAASVDTRNGRAVFRVTDSDEIAHGALAAPLLPFLCIVEGPRVLRDLRLVADDLAFDTCIGACHRDGQALAIGVGAPTICIGVTSVSPVNFDMTVQR
jgi:TldD protein